MTRRIGLSTVNEYDHTFYGPQPYRENFSPVRVRVSTYPYRTTTVLWAPSMPQIMVWGKKWTYLGPVTQNFTIELGLGSEQASSSTWRFRAPLTFREGAWAKITKTGRTLRRAWGLNSMRNLWMLQGNFLFQYQLKYLSTQIFIKTWCS